MLALLSVQSSCVLSQMLRAKRFVRLIKHWRTVASAYSIQAAILNRACLTLLCAHYQLIFSHWHQWSNNTVVQQRAMRRACVSLIRGSTLGSWNHWRSSAARTAAAWKVVDAMLRKLSHQRLLSGLSLWRHFTK